jgi:hypothetical protein
VVELAALEMLCTGNRTVGSNPTLSAKNAGAGSRQFGRKAGTDGQSRLRSRGVWNAAIFCEAIRQLGVV